MKIIVAGSRTFFDYDVVRISLDWFIKSKKINKEDLTIISGHAAGVDKLGERYAKENDIDLNVFPADWRTYGKKAGFIRNNLMANSATDLIAFWDGKSKGTKMMIEIAKDKGLNVQIILTTIIAKITKL